MLFILIYTCRTKEKIVEVKTPVNAWSWAVISYSGWNYAFLSSDPVEDPANCDAFLRWGGYQITFEEKVKGPGGVSFTDENVRCNPGMQYTVEITSSTFGKSSGSVAVPDSIYIINPQLLDTLPKGDIKVTWINSQNADFYRVWIDIDGYVNRYDSTGGWSHVKYIDTFVVADSIIIPSSYFQDTDISVYELHLDVDPYAGGLDSANMRGDFKGYLMAQGKGDFIIFYVGSPVSEISSKCHDKDSLKKTKLEGIKKLIVKIIEYDGR